MKLAVHGGKAVRTKPFPTKKKRFGKEELTQLKEVLSTGNLFGPYGTKVKEFEKRFAKYYGKKYCVTTSSCTASIQTALAAIKINPGDEIITTAVTDMGTIHPILMQNAIPIFCDIDEENYNMDPDKIEPLITLRTKAIIAVHLFGQTCDIDPIIEIAKRHNFYVIEDCAQSYLSTYKGRLNGTIGDIGCFSINDYKHISCGEGGMIITDNEDIAKRAALFMDKCYYRDGSSRNPTFLSLNYRMGELQGAVSLAQLKKLKKIVQARRKICRTITKMLSGVPGIIPPKEMDYAEHSYFDYVVRLGEDLLKKVSIKDFCFALDKEGIPNDYMYMDIPIHQYEMLQNKSTYGDTSCPFGCISYKARDIDYKQVSSPVAERILKHKFIINTHEFFTLKDAKDIAEGIKKVADYYHNK